MYVWHEHSGYVIKNHKKKKRKEKKNCNSYLLEITKGQN